MFTIFRLFCYNEKVNDPARQILERVQPYLDRLDELEWLVNAPEIIADNRYWRRLATERAALLPLAEAAAALKAAMESGGENAVSGILEKLTKLLAGLTSRQSEAVVLEVIASGKDSASFAASLFSAYQDFSQKNELDFLLSSNEADSRKTRCTAQISGEGALSLLKDETGLHRAVFANGLQAEASVLVYAKATANASISENDLKIDVFHSGGAGGQNVNKVESAVRVTHLPTGEVAVCQDERSQLKNKERAIAALKRKVEQFYKKQADSANSAAKAAALKTVSEGKISRSYDFRAGTSKNSLATLTAALTTGGRITGLF